MWYWKLLVNRERRGRGQWLNLGTMFAKKRREGSKYRGWVRGATTEDNQESVASFGSHREKKTKVLQTRFSQWVLITIRMKLQDLIKSNHGPFLGSLRLDALMMTHCVCYFCTHEAVASLSPFAHVDSFTLWLASFFLSLLTWLTSNSSKKPSLTKSLPHCLPGLVVCLWTAICFLSWFRWHCFAIVADTIFSLSAVVCETLWCITWNIYLCHRLYLKANRHSTVVCGMK